MDELFSGTSSPTDWTLSADGSGAWLARWLVRDGEHAGPYRVTGHVAGHRKAYVTWLVLTLRDGTEHRSRILVTRSGVVHELLFLSARVDSVTLDDCPDIADGIRATLHFTRISRLEYRMRQLWRTWRTFRSQPRARRRAARLTPAAIMFDPDSAYNIASQIRAHTSDLAYPDWHARFYETAVRDRKAMARRTGRWRRHPHFQIVLLHREDGKSRGPARDGPSLDATRDSLSRQIYRHFSVTSMAEADLPGRLAGRTLPGATDANAISPPGDWLLFLREGVQLADAALYWLAHTIAARGTLGLVYADEDVVDNAGKPLYGRFKPDWSPELLRSTNYIGEAFVCRADLAGTIAHGLPVDAAYADAIYAALLDVSGRSADVAHISAPLWHVPDAIGAPAAALSSLACAADAPHVVGAYLARQGIDAATVPTGPGRCRVRYALPAQRPMISIVIPTRDGLEHLQRCIASIVGLSSYDNYELIVVDNQSVRPETHAYLAALGRHPRARVLSFDQPFNYSRINNVAAAQARGDLICLLNNDTEVISEDWLEEMAGLLMRDDVGAVGAKLLYADKTVQHGGDTVGPGGCADHLHVGIGADEPGYAGRALVTQELSAVTAACLLTRRDLFLSLGGLEETYLPVAFNDVDYCLRVREAGLRILWTPHAKLYHHESATRGKDVTPEQRRRAQAEAAYMRKRWSHVMRRDPFYNDNLNYLRPDFTLGTVPMIERPWSRGAGPAALFR
jgi:GT2 family glycosyltransferase